MVTAVSGNAVGGDLSLHAIQHLDYSRHQVHHHSQPSSTRGEGGYWEEEAGRLALWALGGVALVAGVILLAQQLALALWVSAYVASLAVALVIGLRYRAADTRGARPSAIAALGLLGALTAGAWLFDDRVHSATWRVAKARLDGDSHWNIVSAWNLVRHGHAGVEVVIASLCAVGLVVAGLAAAWLIARQAPSLWRASGAAAVTGGSSRTLWVLCAMGVVLAVGMSDASTSFLADALQSAMKSQS